MTPTPSLAADARTAPQILIETAAEFAHRGWLLGTCGNMSIKIADDPLRMHVTASGRDKSRLTPDDILVADGDGRALEGEGTGSSEAVIHTVIYRKTDAGAVYHVHTIWNNLISSLCREDGAVTMHGVEMIKGLEDHKMEDRIRIPIVDNDADMRLVAQRVEQAMVPGVPGVIVHLHGIYSWGRTPGEAKRHCEILEFLVELWCRMRSAGR